MTVRSRKKRSEKENEKESENTNQFTNVLTQAMEQLGIDVKEVSHLLKDEKFSQMLQAMTENLKDNAGDQGKNSAIYGFRIGVDKDGMPDFSEFGDIKARTSQKQEEVKDETRETLTEIFIEEEQVRIVAEIPKVDSRNINIRGEEGKIIIEALGDTSYVKEVEITEEVEMKKGTASYRNGILEILIPRGSETNEAESIEIIIRN
ncbi:MAG: Hsp20/alpha crystallin family protein [Candidatus Kariarchaeaceae archaeon]